MFHFNTFNQIIAPVDSAIILNYLTYLRNIEYYTIFDNLVTILCKALDCRVSILSSSFEIVFVSGYKNRSF